MIPLIEQVETFHKKYAPDTLSSGKASAISKETEEFRFKFLCEEMSELAEALEKGDEAEELDAYVDICWVVIGSALSRFGYNAFADACAAVYEDNMKKVKLEGITKIQKPEGWKSPDIKSIVS